MKRCLSLSILLIISPVKGDVTIHGNFSVMSGEADNCIIIYNNNDEKARICPDNTGTGKGMSISIDAGVTKNIALNTDGSVSIPLQFSVADTLRVDPASNKVNINNPAPSLMNGELNVNGSAIISNELIVGGNNTLTVNTIPGRIGINTGNPNVELDVRGDVVISKHLQFFSGTSLLQAIGGLEQSMQVIRGAVDTTSGSPFAQAHYGFTSALGTAPGQTTITFNVPYTQFAKPVIVAICENNDQTLRIAMIKNINNAGFTLETYNTLGNLSGCVVNFIVIGPLE